MNIQTVDCVSYSSETIIVSEKQETAFTALNPAQPHTWLSTVVTAVHVCKGLLQQVASAPSLPVYCSGLKTHLFRCRFLWLHSFFIAHHCHC